MIKKSALGLAVAASLAACGGGGSESTGAAATPAAQAATGERAQAMAVTADGILRFTFWTQDNINRIVVGPAEGVVQVWGVAGVPDGTTYSGIRGIDWLASTGYDNLTLEITQAADFDVNIATGTSNAELDIKWTIPAGAPTAITPSLNITSGPGNKKMQVALESFADDVSFTLSGNTGAYTEFKGDLQFKAGITARPNIDIMFGWYSKAELLVQSEVQHLDGSIALRNTDEQKVVLTSPNLSQTARVVYNPTVNAAQRSIANFEMISGAAAITLNSNVTALPAAREYGMLLVSKRPGAAIDSNLAIGFSGGNDKFNLGYAAEPGSTLNLGGFVNLGGGDDEFTFNNNIANTIFGVALDCGPGYDKANGAPTGVSCEVY